MGECELYRLWHCDSKGPAAVDDGRRYCEKRRARDPLVKIDAVMAGGNGGCWTQLSGRTIA
jgi:hypothetical protein